MSNATIYNKLISLGCSLSGACAIMGNLQAESALQSNNVEDRCHLPDETYTEQVDNGTYTDFATDAYGYGLAQWTYYTRKRELLNFAKSKGVSISDEAMQLEFLVKELKTYYADLWSCVAGKTEETLYKITERICRDFERPAVNNFSQRMIYAAQFYQLYENAPPIDSEPTQQAEKSKLTLSAFESRLIQEILLNHNLLNPSEVDGIIGNKSLNALEKFVTQIKETLKNGT